MAAHDYEYDGYVDDVNWMDRIMHAAVIMAVGWGDLHTNQIDNVAWIFNFSEPLYIICRCGFRELRTVESKGPKTIRLRLIDYLVFHPLTVDSVRSAGEGKWKCRSSSLILNPFTHTNLSYVTGWFIHRIFLGLKSWSLCNNNNDGNESKGESWWCRKTQCFSQPKQQGRKHMCRTLLYTCLSALLKFMSLLSYVHTEWVNKKLHISSQSEKDQEIRSSRLLLKESWRKKHPKTINWTDFFCTLELIQVALLSYRNTFIHKHETMYTTTLHCTSYITLQPWSCPHCIVGGYKVGMEICKSRK